MKVIKRFYVYYQHHLSGKTTVWARKPSFAKRQRLRQGERESERETTGDPFSLGFSSVMDDVERGTWNALQVLVSVFREWTRERGVREGDTYQWTGIAVAQKTSDVAIGHVNLLLDYLCSTHSTPSILSGLWQCISITRTSAFAANACGSCPQLETANHKLAARATKLTGKAGRGWQAGRRLHSAVDRCESQLWTVSQAELKNQVH